MSVMRATGAVELGSVEKEAVAVAARLAELRTDLRVCTSRSAASALVANYDNFVLDCDGVLWMAGSLLSATRETVAMLQGLGKRVIFVTNNSTKSRAMYQRKMAGLGFKVRVEDLIPSSYAAADYLTSEHPEVKKAFVIGDMGLVEELEAAGVRCVGGPDVGAAVSMGEADFSKLTVDADVGAVVCGWDQHFTFRKLCVASLVLQKSPDAPFVATNRDATDRLDDRFIPANGCAIAAIEIASRRPAFCAGKPSKWLARRVVEAHCLDPERTLMVGDRFDTDMLFGNVGGMATALVLTGCVAEEDVIALSEDDPARPDFVLPYFGMLYHATSEGREVPLGAAHASAPCAAAVDADADVEPRSRL